LSDRAMMPDSGDAARVRHLAELDECEIGIEKLVAGGDGMGRFGGLPIFVPCAAPGDRLRVRVVERRRRYARAEILEILVAGGGRRSPPCPHFSRCGGCDLQHLEDEIQTDLKVDAARETLRYIGGLSLPATQRVLRGAPWGYRLRTQLHLEEGEGAPQVGYYERGSHRLVAIESCPVLAPPLEHFVVGLSGRLRDNIPSRLDVALGDDGALTCAPTIDDLPRGEVISRVDGRSYVYDARTFFQSHRDLLGDLIRTVVSAATGTCAYDLYAGVGLFSLALAERYERVVAVEGDRNAARYLRKNTRLARLANIEVVGASVEVAVKTLPAAVERIIVDPPRAGLGFRVRSDIFDRRARHLTYVSCHPAVLARDLKHLCRIYTLCELVFLDLFPQTGHIEVVAQLQLNEK